MSFPEIKRAKIAYPNQEPITMRRYTIDSIKEERRSRAKWARELYKSLNLIYLSQTKQDLELEAILYEISTQAEKDEASA